MGKVIGVCNQKGGTGKTTTVVNLASFFALGKKRTLLIDLDPQANTTSGVGIDRKKIEFSIYDAFSNNDNLEKSVLHTSVPYLHIIPADSSLAGAEIELAQFNNRAFYLREIIEKVKKDFDFVIIDAPPSLGLLTVNILAASDSVIIPVQCEYYALEGLSRLSETLGLISENLNPNLEIEGIVFTMADFRTRLTYRVMEEVKNHFGEKAYHTIIPRNVRLSESPSFGKPIYFYSPFSPGAKAYFNLACEVLGEKIQGVYDEKASVRKRIRSAYSKERKSTEQRIQLY